MIGYHSEIDPLVNLTIQILALLACFLIGYLVGRARK